MPRKHSQHVAEVLVKAEINQDNKDVLSPQSTKRVKRTLGVRSPLSSNE